MARLSGYMRDLCVIKRARPQLCKRRHRRCTHKTIEQHRDALSPRPQGRAKNSGKLASTECCRDRERIGERLFMLGECDVDDDPFACETFVVNTGAAAGPPFPSSAKQCCTNRGCGGRV